FSYLRQVKLPWLLLGVIAACSFISSFIGAASVTLIPVEILKPFVLIMLIVIAIYTVMKKQFGQVHVQQKLTKKMLALAVLGSLAIGVYAGIFGPGTGSFFIFFFIRYFSVDFLHASALSKIANFTTKLAALTFFIPICNVILMVGAMMAVANI